MDSLRPQDNDEAPMRDKVTLSNGGERRVRQTRPALYVEVYGKDRRTGQRRVASYRPFLDGVIQTTEARKYEVPTVNDLIAGGGAGRRKAAMRSLTVGTSYLRASVVWMTPSRNGR